MKTSLFALVALCSIAFCAPLASASTIPVNKKGLPGNADLAFAQLDQLLPTPGTTRTASGAPGPQYWQQKVDYRIKVTLDEKRHRLTGTQTVTYMNRSPDTLNYLWVQLDQNIFRKDSISRRSEVAANSGTRRDAIGAGDSLSFAALRRHQAFEDRDYGFEIGNVRDAAGRAGPARAGFHI